MCLKLFLLPDQGLGACSFRAITVCKQRINKLLPVQGSGSCKPDQSTPAARSCSPEHPSASVGSTGGSNAQRTSVATMTRSLLKPLSLATYSSCRAAAADECACVLGHERGREKQGGLTCLPTAGLASGFHWQQNEPRHAPGHMMRPADWC